MDITTFDLAKELQQCGYPQPEPTFGSWWYGPDGTPYVVICQDNDPRPAIYTKDGWDLFSNRKLIYAPSVLDLISALGERYRIETTTGKLERVFLIVGEKDKIPPMPYWTRTLIEALAEKMIDFLNKKTHAHP